MSKIVSFLRWNRFYERRRWECWGMLRYFMFWSDCFNPISNQRYFVGIAFAFTSPAGFMHSKSLILSSGEHDPHFNGIQLEVERRKPTVLWVRMVTNDQYQCMFACTRLSYNKLWGPKTSILHLHKLLKFFSYKILFIFHKMWTTSLSFLIPKIKIKNSPRISPKS